MTMGKVGVLALGCALAGLLSAAEWTPKFYDGLEANGTVRTVAGVYKGQEECLELTHLSGGFKFGAEMEVESGMSGPVDWTVTAEVECFGGGEAQVGMEFYSADGKLIGAKFGGSVKDAAWRKREWRFHAGANAAKAKVQFLSLAAGGVRFARVKAVPAPGSDTEIALDVRCYPVTGNADWNGGKPEFNSFADAPLPLTFHFKGERGILKDPAFELDLPAGLDVADAFTAHPDCHRAEVPSVKDITRDGRAYRRFRFSNANVFRILQPGFGWGRKMIVIVEPRPGTDISAGFPAYYRVADGERSGEERPLTFVFTKLPTHFREPRCFPVMSWDHDDRYCTKDDVLFRMARAYEAAGCVSFRRPGPKFARGNRIVELLKSRNRGWFFPFGYADLWYERFLGGEGYKDLKVRRVKRDDGSEMAKLCPDYFNTDPEFRAYYEKFVLDSLRTSGVEDGDWITLDFEPWGADHYCMCETCLRKFAAFAGLSEPPPVKELSDKDKYLDRWAQFRIRQCEETIRITSELVHRYNPKLIVCDYDYILFYGSPTQHLFYRGCAKDSKRNEKWFDRHCCSYYHVHDRRSFEAIRNNTRNLEKPYIPVASNDGSGSYLSKAEVRHPRQIRQLALAAFVHGCPGFSFYSGANFDGAHLYAMMKARDEIAALEDFPWGKAEGALRAECGNDQLVFATTAKDGREVIALFNYDRKAKAHAVIRTDAFGTCRAIVNPISGEKLADAVDLKKGFEIDVPPDGVRFVRVDR